MRVNTTVDRPFSTLLPAGPVVVYDMPDEEYHAHPALSYSGAKLLLPPSTPAHYRYEQDHGRAPKREFDLGHAAHKLVLGVGAQLVDIDARDYRTKAAQEARDAAYDAGKVPLLPKERAAAERMAAAVKAHPLAGRLFTRGRPEVSLFWTDEATGVPMRGRLDWLRDPQPGRPLTAVDLKTRDGSVHASVLPKVIDDLRYFVQDANYADGLLACGLVPPEGVAFMFVFVEVKPPHAVNVVDLTDHDINLGRAMMRRAAEIYRDCTASGLWPAHPMEVTTVSLPPYSRRRTEEYLNVD